MALEESRSRPGFRLPPGRVADLLWLGITWVVTSAAAAVVLGLERLRLGVPMEYSGDAKLALANIQTVLERGWFYETDRLGAPLGQKLYDYPFPGDALHMVEFRILGLFTDSEAVVINVFYLLSFLLVATSCFAALRLLRVSRPMSAALSVLYTCLPFHFLRGEPHLFLSNYWIAPLACWLVVRQLGPEPLLVLSRRGLLRRQTLGLAAVCVAAGLTGIYYAAFTAVLLGVTGLARSVQVRDWRPVVSGAALAAVVVAAVGASILPSLLYLRSHGENEAVAHRDYAETEYYGLKLVNLVLPIDNHRIEALGTLRDNASNTPVPGEGSETLGLVGTAGFLGLLVVGLGRLVGGPRRTAGDGDGEGGGGGDGSSLLDRLSALTLVCVLVGVVTGFSAVIAAFGFTSLRGWNRISVFIGFLSLAAVGVAADRVLARVRTTDVARAGLACGVAAVLAVGGVWDQTAPKYAPDYDAIATYWTSDRAFVERLEAELDTGASVFELPVAPFPEIQPIVEMGDYEHVRGYLHSHDLRWSYGSMKGRPESAWMAPVAAQPAGQMVDSLAVIGFDAVWIDRLGYADRAKGLEAELTAVAGPPLLLSGDGRFLVYDLRPHKELVRSTRGASAVARERAALLLAPR